MIYRAVDDEDLIGEAHTVGAPRGRLPHALGLMKRALGRSPTTLGRQLDLSAICQREAGEATTILKACGLLDKDRRIFRGKPPRRDEPLIARR